MPVIIASILDEKPRGLSLGAAEYLIKPVGREALRRCLAPRGGAGRRAAGRRRPEPVAVAGDGLMTGPRILVVEDNPLNLKLVRDVLTAFGFEVVAAHYRRGGREPRRDAAPRTSC